MKTLQLLALAAALCAPSITPCSAGQARFTTLYTLNGQDPVGLTAANGMLYGASAAIGYNCGNVFQLQPPKAPGGAWTETVLYTFTGVNGDACEPNGAPAVGAHGEIYGASSAGGTDLFGTVFELQPPAVPGGTWTETVLHSFTAFSDGGNPYTGVVVGPGGALYGTTSDGAGYGTGGVFKMEPPSTPGGAWSETILYSFGIYGSSGDVATPVSLIMSGQGALYGTAIQGGAYYVGAALEVAPPAAPGGAWTETVLYSFQGYRDGSTPNWVTVPIGGVIYGATIGTTTIGGYPANFGVSSAFQLSPPSSPGGSWTKTILRLFSDRDSDGAVADSNLIVRNGNLYGTVFFAPSGGAVYELKPPASPGGAWTTVILHNFTDGQTPGGALVMDKNGAIYGTTIAPQQPGGTIYRIEP